MIANDALRWALTALLLAAAVYSALRSARYRVWPGRIDYGLHALMMTAIVVMLVPGVQRPVLQQLLLFVFAAWWFVLRARSLRPEPRSAPVGGPRGGAAGRGRLLYNALAMAAMASMLAAMDFRVAQGWAAAPAAAGGLSPAAHHVPAAASGLQPAGTGPGWSSRPALFLAIAFGAAAVLWAALLFRRIRRRPASGDGDGDGDVCLDLVGAASMAVMFAAVAA
ncbi:DUF5134 domain-containing protein [Arthrobacter sp. UYCu712]|uniref:DUF5134 domain-containing protein n=1 Tax=Arthrobacter sp. UYCu712 TaxID=3156340 RepID=UPI0033992982